MKHVHIKAEKKAAPKQKPKFSMGNKVSFIGTAQKVFTGQITFVYGYDNPAYEGMYLVTYAKGKSSEIHERELVPAIKSAKKYKSDTCSDAFNFVKNQQEYCYWIEFIDRKLWTGNAVNPNEAKLKAIKDRQYKAKSTTKNSPKPPEKTIKQPWKIRKQVLIDTAIVNLMFEQSYPNWITNNADIIVTESRTGKQYSHFNKMIKASKAGINAYGKIAHYNIVKQALEAGKPVPENVLKDYPDLVKSTPNNLKLMKQKAKAAKIKLKLLALDSGLDGNLLKSSFPKIVYFDAQDGLVSKTEKHTHEYALFLENTRVEIIIKNFGYLTEKPITAKFKTSFAEIKKLLKKAAKDGYSVLDGETEREIDILLKEFPDDFIETVAWLYGGYSGKELKWKQIK